MRIAILCSAATLAAAFPFDKTFAASPEVELIGVVRLSGELSDLSGLTDKLEDGSVANQFGGLSGIEYAGSGDQFFVLADRGAGDGAVSYPCRFHGCKLVADAASHAIRFELISTQLFASAAGQPLVGSLTALAADHERGVADSWWTALDPEGIRRLADGSFVITDEYGPHVVIVAETGIVAGEISVPKSFRLRPAGREVATVGAYVNRGLEGIAITPSGQRMLAVLQSPLIQDAEIRGDKCLGMNCRWLIFDEHHEVIKQVVYRLANLSTGVSEILAVDEDRFLVLERDSKVGKKAKIKRIFLADITSADDVSGVAALPVKAEPQNIAVVQKTLVIDLLDDRFGLGGQNAPEKPEGLAWGNDLLDGRRTLWVCCDNDFDARRTSDIYCFAVAGLSR